MHIFFFMILVALLYPVCTLTSEKCFFVIFVVCSLYSCTQELCFFVCDFAIRCLYSCELGLYFFFMNCLSLYLRADSSLCLQGN